MFLDKYLITKKVQNISINIRRVDTALISGVIPNLTIEYIFTGNVTLLGPDVKKVTTKSSKESVNANKKDAIIAGLIKGKMINLIICILFAPRSRPASRVSVFKIASLDLIIIAMNGNVKDTWAIIMFDRVRGQISKLGQLIKLKKTSIEIPIQISGMIIGNRSARS